MGLRIMEGHENGEATDDVSMAVMFDSTTGWCFGPTFASNLVDEHFPKGEAAELASHFDTWVRSETHLDPRELDSIRLERLYGRWSVLFAGQDVATAHEPSDVIS